MHAELPGPGTSSAHCSATGRRRLRRLTVSARRISFRHELTRRAIAGSLPSARLVELNQRVPAALVDRYGPAAARDAARAGAHREAVAHFGLVLEHSDRFAAQERAELLEQYAIECYTIGAADRAAGAQLQVVDLTRRRDDLRTLGSSLRWLSRMLWSAGNRSGAEQARLP